jgi:mono/diheme cytochrome c family protein
VRWLTLAVILASWASASCRRTGGPAEGLAEIELPAEVRADYQVFAQRCSKCHSLARPLRSGITDDAFWKEYVDRMRRQAGSGISPSDEEPILRFLHYYSLEEKRKRGGGG